MFQNEMLKLKTHRKDLIHLIYFVMPISLRAIDCPNGTLLSGMT